MLIISSDPEETESRGRKGLGIPKAEFPWFCPLPCVYLFIALSQDSGFFIYCLLSSPLCHLLSWLEQILFEDTKDCEMVALFIYF